MRPSHLILHAAALLVLACPLRAARITRTYALENRSQAPWLILAPPGQPAAADGELSDGALGSGGNEGNEGNERAEIQVTDAGPGPNAWTEASGPAPGFSGQLEARSSLTLAVTFDAASAPPVLHLFRTPGSPREPVLLDLAGPRSGPDAGDGLDGRFILPLDEAPPEPVAAPSPAPRSTPSGPGAPSRNPGPAAPGPEAGGAPATGQGPLSPATSSDPGPEGPAEEAPDPYLLAWERIQGYWDKDLGATLAVGFPAPALAALAGPLGELEACRKAFGIQWAAMEKLLARVAAPTELPIPTYVKTLKVVLVLLEGCENKARQTFVQQADCIMVRLQPSLLKALGATQRRLVNLPASHTRETAEALAAEYRLLSARWQATQCLALEWAAVATTAPWSAWREAVRLPRRTAAMDLHLGWTGAPAPFLATLGPDQDPDQIRFITSDQRIRNMARACGLDADTLTAFDLEAWMRELDRRRTDQGIRVKTLEAQRIMADAARDREQAERAQARQAREAAQKATRLAMQQSEQRAQRQAAARAREQHKRDQEARAAEKRREAEATRARSERETRMAQDQARAAEAARSSREAREREAARNRAEARDALRAQRAVARARREAERKRAVEAEAQRTADSQRAVEAEAQRTADGQRAVEAEAQLAADRQRAAEAQRAADSQRAADAEPRPAAGSAPKGPYQPFAAFPQEEVAVQRPLDRELRIRRLLLIPSQAPLEAGTAARVQAAIRRNWLRNHPGLPAPEPAPAFSTGLIHPLLGPAPAASPRTVQRYATPPCPAPASAE